METFIGLVFKPISKVPKLNGIQNTPYNHIIFKILLNSKTMYNRDLKLDSEINRLSYKTNNLSLKVNNFFLIKLIIVL